MRAWAWLLLVPCGTSGWAQGREASSAPAKTLSPYFVVSGGEDGAAFPLKSTSAQVDIAGVIANVTVKQVYANTGKDPIEAIYVFPGSTRAAVHGLRMTIGERVVEARIAERQEAKATYEKAKAEGKTASLLEQQRPNVFQMNVANILPGDTVKVELRYTELLVPDGGVYEFVYPTVVGPRYSNRPESGASPEQTWTQNPYLHEGEEAPSSFELAATLTGGMPIADLASPSHQVVPAFEGPERARLRLDAGASAGGNRDFVLRYRLAEKKIQTGLLLQRGRDENFFLLMVQPPRREAAVLAPRDYVFVVDVSGSMRGFPLDTAKGLMKRLVEGLGPADTFNMVLFAGASKLLAPSSLPATAENVAEAERVLERASGRGATELLPALRTALALPAVEGKSRSIAIVTDGYVDVEREAFDLIRGSLGQANVFAFGIGTSVNRHLIEGLARVGRGEPFVVMGHEEAPAAAERFSRYVSAPLLVAASVDFDGFEVSDVEPRAFPDLFAERPLVVFGKWKGTPRGTIRLRGQRGSADWTDTIDVARQGKLVEGSALAYLWARERIALLSDYGQLSGGDERSAILELGLRYNLLTRYTSFVAVDLEARRGEGPLRTVKQPLPLPAGVPEQAVGGVPTTPEPETWTLLAVVVAALSFFLLRRGMA